MKAWYLSEMTISPRHGGGLTLMRILGNDLYKFSHYINPIPYPIEGFDNVDAIQDRVLALYEQPGDFVKRPMPDRFTPDYFSNQLKRMLRLPNPKYINWDYYREVYTRYLLSKIDFSNSIGLIVPQNVHSVVLCNELHRKKGIDYVTWMMDDHLLQYDKIREYHYPYPEGYENELKYHLQNAAHVFTISKNMGEFYRSKFGISYSVLFSPSNARELKHSDSQTAQRPLRFCHFGRVWRWTKDAVDLFARFLEPLDATLDIYSFLPLEGPLKDNPRVIVKEPVQEDKVINLIRTYDAVTIFYGFSDEVRPLSELNISTKMSECLASGLPTIFVGPSYAAMTQWALEKNCGVIIDNYNEAMLSRLAQLRDREMYANISKRCLESAQHYTSFDFMRAVWERGWQKSPKHIIQ